MKPIPYIVKHEDWEDFAEKRTQAAYEKIDNLIDKYKALHITKDIVAGAFRDEGTIYFDEKRWGDVLLTEHELGHFWDTPGENHPTTLIKGIIHAHKCHYDSRAFTSLLRFKRNKAIQAATDAWLDYWMTEFRDGRLLVLPKP